MNLFRHLFGREAERKPEKTVVPQPPPPQLSEVEETKPMQPAKTQPLAPQKVTSRANQRIRYGLASDVGQVRTNNQDASLTFLANVETAANFPTLGFFVVADGMGGHTDGELASAVTVQTLAHHVIDEVLLPQLEGRQPSAEQKTIAEVLAEAMEAANEAVQLRVPNGGTTATCVVIRGDLAYIAHVGDSRAYLLSDSNMELITRDHSLVRRLQELGQITAEQAETHPQRNVLYRAIGQGESLEVDAATRRLPPSSQILLCSDGLWGVVDDKRIREIVKQCSDPQEACDRLVAEANAKGGPDNITVLLVQLPG